MKLIIMKLSIFALCCLIPITSYPAGGSMGWLMIDSMEQRPCLPSKGFEITFMTTHANPDVCSNNKTVEVECDLPTYKAILAMALTAQTAGLEVNGWVSGCDAQGQAILKSIEIR